MKFFLFVLFLSLPALAQENCDPQTLAMNSLDSFAQQNLAAANMLFKNVLKFNVKMAGDGNISVLLDERGNLEAIRLNYNHNNEKKFFILDREKLESADRISLPGRPGENDQPPLQFYPVKPPGLDFVKGGAFKIAITTEQSPPRVEEYVVTLRKSGSDWIIDQRDRQVKEMTLHPGLSFLSWKGTFNKIDFR